MYDVRLTRDRRGAQVNSLPNITSYVAKNTSVLSVSTIYLAVPSLSSLLAPLRYSGETHSLAQSHHHFRRYCTAVQSAKLGVASLRGRIRFLHHVVHALCAGHQLRVSPILYLSFSVSSSLMSRLQAMADSNDQSMQHLAAVRSPTVHCTATVPPHRAIATLTTAATTASSVRAPSALLPCSLNS
jgi:hypothetical protein